MDPKKIPFDHCETIFDIFALVFAEAKTQEGALLSEVENAPETWEPVYRTVRARLKQAAGSQTGSLYGSVDEHFGLWMRDFWRNNPPAAAMFAFIKAVDELFPRRYRRRTLSPLNTVATNKILVYPAPRGSLMPAGTAGGVRTLKEIGDRLENYLQHLTVLPAPNHDYQIDFLPLPELIEKHSLTPGETRLAVIPWRRAEDHPELDIVGRGPGGEPHFSIKASEPEAGQMEALVDDLENHNINIALFPELTMTEKSLLELKTSMGQRFADSRGENYLKIVAAGSLHRSESGRRLNECSVLGPDGRTLWTVTKMNRYRILPEELDSPQTIKDRGAVEGIDISKRALSVCDCSIGRLVVIICLDYLLPETYNLLAPLRTNLILVPAMTPSVNRFENLAWWHGTASRAVTCVGNAFNLPDGRKEKNSFIYRPLRSADQAYSYFDHGFEPDKACLILDEAAATVETIALEIP